MISWGIQHLSSAFQQKSVCTSGSQKYLLSVSLCTWCVDGLYLHLPQCWKYLNPCINFNKWQNHTVDMLTDIKLEAASIVMHVVDAIVRTQIYSPVCMCCFNVVALLCQVACNGAQ